MRQNLRTSAIIFCFGFSLAGCQSPGPQASPQESSVRAPAQALSSEGSTRKRTRESLASSTCWTLEKGQFRALFRLDAEGRVQSPDRLVPYEMYGAKYWDKGFIGRREGLRAFLLTEGNAPNLRFLRKTDRKPAFAGYIAVNGYLGDRISSLGVWSPGDYRPDFRADGTRLMPVICGPSRLTAVYPAASAMFSSLVNQTGLPDLQRFAARFPEAIREAVRAADFDAEYGEGFITGAVEPIGEPGLECKKWKFTFNVFLHEFNVYPLSGECAEPEKF